jgi:hypothetical protein
MLIHPWDAAISDTVARHVENDNPELAGVERGAGAAGRRAVQRVRVVGHEHDGELTVLAPGVVDQAQRGRLPAGAEHASAVSSRVGTFASR